MSHLKKIILEWAKKSRYNPQFRYDTHNHYFTGVLLLAWTFCSVGIFHSTSCLLKVVCHILFFLSHAGNQVEIHQSPGPLAEPKQILHKPTSRFPTKGQYNSVFNCWKKTQEAKLCDYSTCPRSYAHLSWNKFKLTLLKTNSSGSGELRMFWLLHSSSCATTGNREFSRFMASDRIMVMRACISNLVMKQLTIAICIK